MSEPNFSRPAIGQGSGNGTGTPGPAAEDDAGAGQPWISPRRLTVFASLCGGLAALCSFGVGEARLLDAAAKHERFVVGGQTIVWSTPATKEVAATVTSARLHAVFGGLLGLFLGCTGGWARRSARAAVTAGLLGAGLGAAYGAVVPRFVQPAYARYRQVQGGDLAASLVMHGVLWAGIGAAGGLALGLGLGGRSRTWRAALGGLIGALGGALLYDLLGAVVFPLEETGLPTSSSARTRLLARIMVAVLAAAGAAQAASNTRPREGTAKRTSAGELDTV
jgi:hypothetical protein